MFEGLPTKGAEQAAGRKPTTSAKSNERIRYGIRSVITKEEEEITYQLCLALSSERKARAERKAGEPSGHVPFRLCHSQLSVLGGIAKTLTR